MIVLFSFTLAGAGSHWLELDLYVDAVEDVCSKDFLGSEVAVYQIPEVAVS